MLRLPSMVVGRPAAVDRTERRGAVVAVLQPAAAASVGALLQRAAPGTDSETRSLPMRRGGLPPQTGAVAAWSRGDPTHIEENSMLHYAVVFLVIALIAAVLGFGGIAAGAAGIAKILFMVFIVLAIASFLVSLVRRG
jgi:uncharacterized membrane protein YtjA (UPF0391 family)